MSKSPESENLHELSRERSALRQELEKFGVVSADTLDEIRSDEDPREGSLAAKDNGRIDYQMATQAAAEGLKEVESKLAGWSIKSEGGLTKAKERISADRASAEKTGFINEEQIVREMGPSYESLRALGKKTEDLRDFEMKRMMEASQQADPYKRQVTERIILTAQKEREKSEAEKATLEKMAPLAARAYDLVEYKKGLYEEGHIASTPTVQKYLEEIGDRMLAGKPMFLHGPTGTGKTSLARLAARHFTGKDAEMVYCNPQTRESNIWGKTGIRATEKGPETVDVFGPLARAITEGKPVIFDEFTALPKDQQVFIKGIFNAKPGDMVNIVGNGKVEMASGFQLIFTANLKSKKNPERQELPPEIAREFEQNNLKIGYSPKEEAYDIMLARLMNPDGSLDLSWTDINETLPKLAEAMEEIQIAYTDTTRKDTAKLTGTEDASGATQGLDKFVMTQGSIEAMLSEWRLMKMKGKNGASFVEFIDNRLKTALTFEEYPEKDRILAAKILASKGFLRTKTAEELGLPRTVLDFDAAKKLRSDAAAIEELKRESGEIAHLSLKEVAELDPFEVRKKKAAKKAAQFKKAPASAPNEEVVHPTDRKIIEGINKGFLEETFKQWGIDNAKINTRQESVVWEPLKNLNYKSMANDTDPAKFGEYTLNPETQNINWETIDKSKIFIPDLKAFEGKELYKVAEHLVATYSAKYYIPGIEYWKWLIQNHDKAPDVLKDTSKYFFFFGSVLRSSGGRADVPYVDPDRSSFYRRAHWLDNGWGSDCRVVLLEK